MRIFQKSHKVQVCRLARFFLFWAVFRPATPEPVQSVLGFRHEHCDLLAAERARHLEIADRHRVLPESRDVQGTPSSSGTACLAGGRSI